MHRLHLYNDTTYEAILSHDIDDPDSFLPPLHRRRATHVLLSAQEWGDVTHELDRLRAWKVDASAALDQYEDLRARIEGAMQRALEIR